MLRFGWGDDEKRYLVLSFEGQWSIKDFQTTLSELSVEAKTSPHPLCLMIDLRRSANPPTNILSILGSSEYQSLCGIQRITIISNRAIWKRLYKVFEQLYEVSHRDLLFVDTVDAAYARLVDSASA
jgi:DNA integrity scanning protein DisA with diadenylate cyclase activity